MKSSPPARPASLLDALLESLHRKEPVALVTVIKSQDPAQVGRKAVVWLGRPPLGALGLAEVEQRVLADAAAILTAGKHQTLRYPDQGLELFVEVQHRPAQLIIVGAGHIVVPLCEMAALCGFSVIVIDDRSQFANRQRFPTADQVIAADIRQTLRDLPMDANTFVVLVTRGHSLDVECLLEIIDRPLAYVGMIGSKRRVRAVFDLLEREQGVPRARLDRVFAPIGLAIGAESPAEIAVSILAEIINVYRGGSLGNDPTQRRRPTLRDAAQPPLPTGR